MELYNVTFEFSSVSIRPQQNQIESSIYQLLYLLRIPLTVINCIGVFGNIFLFIALIILRRKNIIAEAGVIVLQNQAIADFHNSLLTLLFTFGDLNNLPEISQNFEWIRLFACMFWHVQYPYWYFYCISVFNEMTLSLERYIAIVHPFQQYKFRKKIPLIITGNYLFHIIFNIPYIFYNDYDFENRRCFARPFEGTFILIRLFAVIWAIEAYIVPGLGLIVFNFMTIRTLKISDKMLGSHITASNQKDLKSKAGRLLAKTATTIGVSFFLTMTYCNYFFVTQSLDGSYDSYDVRNIFGIGLATFHFSMNPLIILFFLPGIRRLIINLFTKQKLEFI